MHILTAITAVLTIMYLLTFKDDPERACALAEESGAAITTECQQIADEWNAQFGN